MDNIIKIIKEEVSKVYQEIGDTSKFPMLNDKIAIFNELVDENYEDVKKIDEKSYKYNLSDVKKIESDEQKLEGYASEIEEIVTFIKLLRNQSKITDDEHDQLENIEDKMKSYEFSISNLQHRLYLIRNSFQELLEGLMEGRKGSIPFQNTEADKIKIFNN